MGTSDADEKLAAPFRELFELSPDAIIVFLGGLVAHVNPAAVALLRARSSEDLVGRKSSTLIAPESHPTVERNAAQLMAGSARSTRSEERYLRLDGTMVDVEATAARAPFLHGKAFIVFLRDITDRKEAEERLRRERESAARTAAAEERERWLRALIDLLPIVVFAMNGAGAFVLVNQRCAELFERPAGEILGKTLRDLGFAADAWNVGENEDILRTGVPRLLAEGVVTDLRGRKRVFAGAKVLLKLGEGEPAVLGAMTELTERRELEQQLLHSQKMEGIGRLAGGIAHDFNNLLTVIIESTEHLSGTTEDAEEDLPRIRDAAARAATLTRQLLAFAHRAPRRLQVIAIDELVKRMARLLTRVLGEDVELVTVLDATGAYANVDPSQLDVMLMNFAVNARDAMPHGGTLVVSTRVVREELEESGNPVRCIALEVKDTGTGMDEATRTRAFEPFFTTKQLGKGTGLGLATSYGIVKQLGGRIDLTSTPGLGTTVRVLLPMCSPVSTRAEAERPLALARPQETILLLEDDHPVRRATARILRSLGYDVLDAALPSEAMALAREHSGPIDLLITDMVMPEMNGLAAARAFREARPSTAVLFVSGYSPDTFTDVDGDVPPLLPKPFSRMELAAAVREALERGP